MDRTYRLMMIGILLALIPAAVLATFGDIVWQVADVEERGVAPAVFPHWIHRVRYKCYACHPAPFQMQAGSNPITMDAMRAGQYCGECHNGQTAWGIGFDTCNRCHVGE